MAPKSKQTDTKALFSLAPAELFLELSKKGWLDHSDPLKLSRDDLPEIIHALEASIEICRALTPDKWDDAGIYDHNKLSRILIALLSELEIVVAHVPSRLLQVKPPPSFNRRANHPAMPRLQVSGAAASIAYRNLLGMGVDEARGATVRKLEAYGVKRSLSAIRDWERVFGSTDDCQKLLKLAHTSSVAPRAYEYMEEGLSFEEASQKARENLTRADVEAAIDLVLGSAARLSEGE